MATYIKTLKEDNGDIVYPQTITDAIYTSGGQTLETRISQYVTAEDIASTAQSFGTITSGMIDWTTMVNKIYPVGSIYMSATLSTAAAVEAALGGTWVAWGSGRVPVGVDTNDTDFDTAEETGGEKKHQLTEPELPTVSATWTIHGQENGTEFYMLNGKATGTLISNKYRTAGATTSGANSYGGPGIKFGSDTPHNNLQPYITCYMYKRTA